MMLTIMSAPLRSMSLTQRSSDLGQILPQYHRESKSYNPHPG